MTLNMPAMKAYLARKDHRSLATLPGVALALNDRNRPAALGYCDTPRVFELLYPYVLDVWHGDGAAQRKRRRSIWTRPSGRRPRRSGPTCGPTSPPCERTPHGLQLTCRYCLPTGGANGPLYLIVTSTLGGVVKYALPLVPSISQRSAGQSESPRGRSDSCRPGRGTECLALALAVGSSTEFPRCPGARTLTNHQQPQRWHRPTAACRP